MDYLPKIKMDFIPNEEEESENIEENVVVKESEELECDILGKEELIPEPTKKNESMNTNEIFESISEPKPIRDPNLTKKGKPRKKRPPMSAEHKEKLKVAREKALEVRRASSKTKKEDKELIKKEKQLLRKQKEQTVQKLEKDTNEFSDLPELEPAPQKKEINIEEAVFNGITQYEIIRKQRKKEKKENEKKIQHSQQIKEQLTRAIAPKKPNNPFYNCY